MKPLKVVVDCDRWCRAGARKRHGRSRLLNTENNRCCLGFVAQKLGYEDEALRNAGTLEEVEQHPSCRNNVLCSFAEDLLGVQDSRFTFDAVVSVQDSRFTCDAVMINDDKKINDATRMSKLRALGKNHGVEFRFTHVPKRKK